MTTHPHPDRPSTVTVGDIVAVAAFFALVAGAGETVSYAVSRYVLARLTGMNPGVAWMAPVAYVVCFLPVVLGLVLVRRVRPREVTLPLVVGVFAFLTAFALLLPYGSIATWASMLVALGVAVRAATAAQGGGAAWRRVARRGTLVLAGALGTVASATVIAQRVGERREVAELPAARAAAPNVLLIILDTVRRSNLSAYGYTRPTTPHLSRLASEGVLFRRANSTAPWTLPSHAAMFSGVVLDTTVGGGWRTPARLPGHVLAEVFRSQGYMTAGFTANVAYTSRESGLTRGFTHFEGHRVTAGGVLLHAAYARTNLVLRLQQSRSWQEAVRAVRYLNLRTVRKPSWTSRPAPLVTDEFLQWQAGAGGRPFFAFLNYMEAHDPFRSPDRYRHAFGTGQPVDEYDGAIAYLDAEIGRLVDSLAVRGELDRTVLVVASDHGEQFGEHGLKGHANSLYRPVLAVPLIVRYPAGVPAGHEVEARVSLADLAPTVAELAGIGAGRFPGTSLTDHWRDDGPDPVTPVIASVAQGMNVDASLPNASGAMTTVHLGDLKYIRHESGREELYDLRTDTAEARNLARVPAALRRLVRMRAILDSAVAASRRASAASAPG